MSWSRTILAFLLSFTLVFAPLVSVAMAKSCTMTSQMTDDGTADCPCHDSMSDCGSMPQCRTAAGCASQCFASCGVVPAVVGQFAPDHGVVKMSDNQQLSSLSIKPPAPPPRA